jgi:ADP-heptose:LPS heptosyltransferase
MGWGDELMVTGRVRELQRTDPRPVKILYERGRWHEAWEHNPRIAPKGAAGEFQELRPRTDYLRPYMRAKSEQRYTWKAYGPPVGELYLTDKEKAFGALYAGRIVIEPNLKGGASINKDWGRERWGVLVGRMRERGLAATQLGPANTRRLGGAEFIETNNMRYAAAVLARARAAVLPEGGQHHVAAAVGCPAVVIFGGYIAPAVTGYPWQSNLFVHDEQHPLGCGWRVRCAHCAAAMARIHPERVLQELEALLVSTSRDLAA